MYANTDTWESILSEQIRIAIDEEIISNILLASHITTLPKEYQTIHEIANYILGDN